MQSTKLTLILLFNKLNLGRDNNDMIRLEGLKGELYVLLF